jgi:Tfp pilus assembly protein PilF
MRFSRTSSFLLFIVIVPACGGTKPAPQNGGPTPPASASAAPEPTHAPEFAAGLQAFDAGDYPTARKDFDAAAKSNPADYEALWNLGQACEKLGDNMSAAAAYRAELGIKPDADQASAELANLYVIDGRIDDALAVANAGLSSHPGSGVLHAAMGQALATRGDQDQALKQFEQAIQLNAADPMLHYMFAVWLNKWKVRGAAAHLDAALPLVKNDYPMIVSIGHEYRLAGEFDSCVKTFDGAIKTTDGGEVRTERALCKLGQKDEAGAMADLQAAIAADSGYAQAHFFLAGRLAAGKRYKEAATEYQTYIQLAPNGSLADQANQRLAAAQDAAVHDKGAIAPKKKNK